ncbi:hypothetical protein PLICRDRAFT_30449 [Plicaturopsis crispa FD-325 SS-3]|nr:hypothetical protein PLICRDRAFT_30449 [Plicaturopsis crispa FD-325 SS-3]
MSDQLRQRTAAHGIHSIAQSEVNPDPGHDSRFGDAPSGPSGIDMADPNPESAEGIADGAKKVPTVAEIRHERDAHASLAERCRRGAEDARNLLERMRVQSEEARQERNRVHLQLANTYLAIERAREEKVRRDLERERALEEQRLRSSNADEKARLGHQARERLQEWETRKKDHARIVQAELEVATKYARIAKTDSDSAIVTARHLLERLETTVNAAWSRSRDVPRGLEVSQEIVEARMRRDKALAAVASVQLELAEALAARDDMAIQLHEVETWESDMKHELDYLEAAVHGAQPGSAQADAEAQLDVQGGQFDPVMSWAAAGYDAPPVEAPRSGSAEIEKWRGSVAQSPSGSRSPGRWSPRSPRPANLTVDTDTANRALQKRPSTQDMPGTPMSKRARSTVRSPTENHRSGLHIPNPASGVAAHTSRGRQSSMAYGIAPPPRSAHVDARRAASSHPRTPSSGYSPAPSVPISNGRDTEDAWGHRKRRSYQDGAGTPLSKRTQGVAPGSPIAGVHTPHSPGGVASHTSRGRLSMHALGYTASPSSPRRWGSSLEVPSRSLHHARSSPAFPSAPSQHRRIASDSLMVGGTPAPAPVSSAAQDPVPDNPAGSNEVDESPAIEVISATPPQRNEEIQPEGSGDGKSAWPTKLRRLGLWRGGK